MDTSLDSYYEIGNDHVVCEDYALHGYVNDIYYAIVADGCSSSKNTDVGSRMLAHAAVSALANFNNKGWLKPFSSGVEFLIEDEILRQLTHISMSLHLPLTAFDSTLVMSIVYDKVCWSFFWGDGCLIYNNEGRVTIHTVSYQEEAPYYLSYKLDRMRDSQYRLSYQPQDKFSSWITLDTTTGEVSEPIVEKMNDPLQCCVVCWELDKFFDAMPVSIAVSTDGINSYDQYHYNYPVDVVKLAKEYTSYKTTKGDFVKRRMKRFRRDCIRNGTTHYDDIACAAIHIKDSSDESSKN